MNRQELRQSLAEHPFLQGLDDRQFDALASMARSVSLAAGAMLGREGEPAEAFYLVQSGRVALEVHTPDRGGVRILTVGAGEPVGWSWLVPPHRWQFDARAVDAVRAIAIDGAMLRQHCEQDHDLGYLLLKRLVAVVASRLAATRLQLLDIYK